MMPDITYFHLKESNHKVIQKYDGEVNIASCKIKDDLHCEAKLVFCLFVFTFTCLGFLLMVLTISSILFALRI